MAEPAVEVADAPAGLLALEECEQGEGRRFGCGYQQPALGEVDLVGLLVAVHEFVLHPHPPDRAEPGDGLLGHDVSSLEGCRENRHLQGMTS